MNDRTKRVIFGCVPLKNDSHVRDYPFKSLLLNIEVQYMTEFNFGLILQSIPTIAHGGDDPEDDHIEEYASGEPQQQNKDQTDQHANHQTTENHP